MDTVARVDKLITFNSYRGEGGAREGSGRHIHDIVHEQCTCMHRIYM